MNILRRIALVIAVIVPSAAFAEITRPAESCCPSPCCSGCPFCHH